MKDCLGSNEKKEIRNRYRQFVRMLIILLTVCSFTMQAEAAERAVKKVTLNIGRKEVTGKNFSMEKGAARELKVRATPYRAVKSIRYKSSNPNIVSVKNGILKAKKVGRCRIKVIVTGKNGKKTRVWFKVQVTPTEKDRLMSIKKQADPSEKQLSILMIGNSLTSYNDLAGLVAENLNVYVESCAVRGSSLTSHSNPNCKTGAATYAALESRKWTFVIIQEQSSIPFLNYDKYSNSVRILCEKIRDIGAVPVLYATWAYQTGCMSLSDTGCTHKEMYELLHEANLKIAEEYQLVLADVGTVFLEKEKKTNLYRPDGVHPTLAGSKLAASVISDAIYTYMSTKPEGSTAEVESNSSTKPEGTATTEAESESSTKPEDSATEEETETYPEDIS